MTKTFTEWHKLDNRFIGLGMDPQVVRDYLTGDDLLQFVHDRAVLIVVRRRGGNYLRLAHCDLTIKYLYRKK